MKKTTAKLLTGIVGIAASVVLIGGSTMAWFTDHTTLAATKFTAGTVKISAGQKVVENDPLANKTYYKEIQSESFVPKKLSSGDSFTAKLQESVKQGDVMVIEFTFGSLGTKTISGKISVSADNTTWTDAKTFSNTSFLGNLNSYTFSSPISNVQYVRIQNTTPSSKSSDGSIQPNCSTGDFTIASVTAREILDETNWNPGDTNHIAFYVNNDGSKDILLRAKLVGQWTDKNGKVIASDPVTITLRDSSWTLGTDGYYYYHNQAIGLKGTAGGETPTTQKWDTNAVLDLNVALSGSADNTYQGATYQITPTFEAIQASHNANSSDADWSAGKPVPDASSTGATAATGTTPTAAAAG